MKLSYQSDRKKNPDKHEFRTLTDSEILNLRYGTRQPVILSSGNVGEVKINGKVRTWKRDAERNIVPAWKRTEVPVKYGLHEYAVFDFTEARERFVKEVTE